MPVGTGVCAAGLGQNSWAGGRHSRSDCFRSRWESTLKAAAGSAVGHSQCRCGPAPTGRHVRMNDSLGPSRPVAALAIGSCQRVPLLLSRLCPTCLLFPSAVCSVQEAAVTHGPVSQAKSCVSIRTNHRELEFLVSSGVCSGR